jgi:sec-independent protein translocase protein TatA
LSAGRHLPAAGAIGGSFVAIPDSTARTGGVTMDIGPGELIIVGIVLLLVFGGSKIPQLAKNLGLAKSEFEKGMHDDEEPKAETAQTAQTELPAPPSPGGS